MCTAVKINNVTVPSRYELKQNADPLILYCDFTVNADETGFVLKWLHNSVSIYQWIPSKKVPFALVKSTTLNRLNRLISDQNIFQGNFKDRVKIDYSTSDDRYKKHSALFISNPMPSDSGTYTCNVQTFQGKKKISNALSILICCLLFQGNDKKASDLQIIGKNSWEEARGRKVVTIRLSSQIRKTR